MKTNRKSLSKILKSIKPVISKKGNEELSKKVFFTGQDIVAYNEAMCIAWPFESDFSAILPSEELISIIDNFKGEEIDLVFSKDCLNIKSDQARARLKAIADDASFMKEATKDIILKTEDPNNWYEIFPEMLRGIELCMYNTSKDPAFAILQCVCLKGDVIISSDDFRISQFTLEQTPFVFGDNPKDILIPYSSCAQIVRYKFSSYKIDNGWVYFVTDENMLLATRLVEGAYDNVDQFMDFEGSDFILPNSTIKSVRTASTLAPGDHDIEKEIKITIGNGKIIFRAEKEVGWVTIEEEYKDAPNAEVSFMINPIFFQQVLELTNNKMKIGTDRGLFTKDNFRLLISIGML